VRLFFFRHGPAGSQSEWPGPDDDRPLTAEGRAIVARAGRSLARAGVTVDAVLTSPLTRARQTAEIAADKLGLTDRLFDDDRLAHGLDRRRLTAIIAEHPDAQALMLVGHEPDFSATIAELTGGAVVMKKAGVARVDLDESTMRGRLVWLVPPRILTPQ
jgi:phosphohistidine phosphatase